MIKIQGKKLRDGERELRTLIRSTQSTSQELLIPIWSMEIPRSSMELLPTRLEAAGEVPAQCAQTSPAFPMLPHSAGAGTAAAEGGGLWDRYGTT